MSDFVANHYKNLSLKLFQFRFCVRKLLSILRWEKQRNIRKAQNTCLWKMKWRSKNILTKNIFFKKMRKDKNVSNNNLRAYQKRIDVLNALGNFAEQTFLTFSDGLLFTWRRKLILDVIHHIFPAMHFVTSVSKNIPLSTPIHRIFPEYGISNNFLGWFGYWWPIRIR